MRLKWKLVLVHFEIVLILTQNRCTVRINHFLMHPMLHRGDEAQVVAHFSPFGDSVILTQDRCTVCIEHTIGSEIVLDATNGTHR